MIRTGALPKVLDADALNALAKKPDVLLEKAGEIVITPHPKEFSRLCGLSVEEILADPVAAARAFANKYGVVVLLKGAVSVAAGRDGATLVAAGSPGMAKGGSGDVLTGVIASLCAQGFGTYESAVLGALACGAAGSMAALGMGEYGMTAGDTIEYLGRAMDSLAGPVLDGPRVPARAGSVRPQPAQTPAETPDPPQEEREPAGFTVGAEGLEKHFRFLSPEEEYASRPQAADSSPFDDRPQRPRRDGFSFRRPLR